MSEKREARNRAIIEWVEGGPEGEVDHWENEVWWGYWRDAGGEGTEPPDALFPSEELAEAYATLVAKDYDVHVGPCVLDILVRDNLEVPE